MKSTKKKLSELPKTMQLSVKQLGEISQATSDMMNRLITDVYMLGYKDGKDSK